MSVLGGMLPEIIVALFGIAGGGGGVAIFKSKQENRERKAITEAIGAKTPREVESIAVATMADALESARGQITTLTARLESDRLYYEQRDQERLGRITDLTTQLEQVREKLRGLEQHVSELLEEVQKHTAAPPHSV